MITKLKRCRIRSGLLQAELAKKAQVSLSMMSRYENGWVEPSRCTANRIASALGRELEDVFNLKKQAKEGIYNDQ